MTRKELLSNAQTTSWPAAPASVAPTHFRTVSDIVGVIIQFLPVKDVFSLTLTNSMIYQNWKLDITDIKKIKKFLFLYSVRNLNHPIFNTYFFNAYFPTIFPFCYLHVKFEPLALVDRRLKLIWYLLEDKKQWDGITNSISAFSNKTYAQTKWDASKKFLLHCAKPIIIMHNFSDKCIVYIGLTIYYAAIFALFGLHSELITAEKKLNMEYMTRSNVTIFMLISFLYTYSLMLGTLALSSYLPALMLSFVPDATPRLCLSPPTFQSFASFFNARKAKEISMSNPSDLTSK